MEQMIRNARASKLTSDHLRQQIHRTRNPEDTSRLSEKEGRELIGNVCHGSAFLVSGDEND